jgi:hypothetical protein
MYYKNHRSFYSAIVGESGLLLHQLLTMSRSFFLFFTPDGIQKRATIPSRAIPLAPQTQLKLLLVSFNAKGSRASKIRSSTTHTAWSDEPSSPSGVTIVRYGVREVTISSTVRATVFLRRDVALLNIIGWPYAGRWSTKNFQNVANMASAGITDHSGASLATAMAVSWCPI